MKYYTVTLILIGVVLMFIADAMGRHTSPALIVSGAILIASGSISLAILSVSKE